MSVYSQVSSYSDYVDLQHYTGSAGSTGAGPEMSGAFWLSGSLLTDTTFFFNSKMEAPGLTLETGASVTAILDQDNMSGDSATALATQQSIKAYVDSQVASGNDLSVQADGGGLLTVDLATDDFNITGSTNLFISGSKIGTEVSFEACLADTVAITHALTAGTTISGAAAISGRSFTADTGGTIGCAADTDLMTLTANTLTVAGATNSTTVSGSGQLSGMNLVVDTGGTIGLAADTDLLTLTANTLTVAGTVNASTALSASTTVKGRSFTADTGGTIGCAADTDLMTLTANTLTVAGAANATTVSGSGAVSGGSFAGGTTVTAGTTMSASQGISGRSLTVDTGLTIGCAADTDLLTLAANTLTVAGTVNVGTALSASTTLSGRSLTVDNGLTIGCAADTDLLTLSNGNVTFTGTTVIATADVNGGAIDAVTIGSNSACTALTVNGANAQSITSTGANNVSLTAGNNIEITANGTDAEDGITLQLGNTTNTVFMIANSADTGLLEYTAAGLGEHNGDNADADFKFNSDTDTDYIAFDAEQNAFICYDGGNETVRIGGDATTDYALDVKDGANAINKIRAAAFVTYSDERLKTDVVEMNNALKTVNSIKAVNFTWKKDGTQDFGFLAQDLKKVIPQAVHGNDDGLLGVDYGRLTSVLVKAIQEQSVQIKALQEKLDK